MIKEKGVIILKENKLFLQIYVVKETSDKLFFYLQIRILKT
jgi:hypothetical protein